MASKAAPTIWKPKSDYSNRFIVGPNAATKIRKSLVEATRDQENLIEPIMGEGFRLFKLATEAFDANVVLGACLLCRAALESDCLGFLIHRWIDGAVVTLY